MPSPVSVTLLTRPGCHLCDDAREIVVPVVAEFGGAELTEVSIDDDPSLAATYAEEIPVVLINDRVHNIWRVNADRLRDAIREAAQ